MAINYEDLCQWRDICEFLSTRWYLFADDYDISKLSFNLLTEEASTKRQELWTRYMIQFVAHCRHPHARYHRRSDYKKDFGWVLVSDWELKIDFLEQIVLLGRAEEDLPRPWCKAIWERFFRRREQEIKRERLMEEWRERNRMEVELFNQSREEKIALLKAGDCPARFHCKSMTGAHNAGSCENFEQCKGLAGSL